MRPSPVVPEAEKPVPGRPALRVVPEPTGAPQPERRVPLITTIGLVVVAIIVSSSIVYVWQHRQVVARDSTIASLQQNVTGLQDQNAALGAQLTTAQQTIAAQQGQITALHGQNAALHEQNAALQTQYQLATGNQQATQQELTQTQQQLAQTQQQLTAAESLIGPATSDGTYVTYIRLAGSVQDPPRVVIDRAKIVNGVLVNDSQAWRTLQVAKDASVVVLSLNPYHPQTISLDRFAHLYLNPAPWAVRVTVAPFTIVVSDNVVTSIHEIHPSG